jgi:hypothetical protein
MQKGIEKIRIVKKSGFPASYAGGIKNVKLKIKNGEVCSLLV